MRYLLDTNIWILYLKGGHPVLRAKLEVTDRRDIVTCPVVWAELLYGARRYEKRSEREAKVEAALSALVCLPSSPHSPTPSGPTGPKNPAQGRRKAKALGYRHHSSPRPNGAQEHSLHHPHPSLGSHASLPPRPEPLPARTMKPLLTALIAFAMGSAIRTQAACTMWNVPSDYLSEFGGCETAPGVMIFAPFIVSKLVAGEPFIEYLEFKLPYAQRSDSPWAAGIRQGSIYVEDFEDGLVNTPGLAMALGIMSPGSSVDEDDGILGNQDDDTFHGRYWYAGVSGPSHTARAEFSPNGSGNYPLYAGWAMDTGDFADAKFEAFDPSGQLIASYLYILEWGEIQFVGVHAQQGIGAIQSTGNVNLFVDHVQYGYAIPEPNTALLTATTALAAASRRRRAPARPLP